MTFSILNYKDILEDRRNEFSNYVWLSRKFTPQVVCKQIPRPTPSTHKLEVLKHPRIQDILEQISAAENVSKDELEKKVSLILDEIGYNKNLRVIRWLGMVLVKICLNLYSGVYINKDSILHTKSALGCCPVIFVPSHRSYADFICMSILCFTYDVEIPAVAAGMDFHGMFGMGSLLRDTGAFFMRRSYNDDSLYWATFKQYIYQLVTKGDLPIEFFIEGTRSRSNKSLLPKYGLLNMILKPLFLREVPDILFVPINISYDKILEEKLFAYELLGVPKPKETTSGLFKSLSIIKEKYGSIFFTFDKPISSREFFGEKLDASVHSLGPLYHQELTEYDKNIIPPLAHEIVRCQQKGCVLNSFNLIAIILNHNLVTKKKLLSKNDLIKMVAWLRRILEEFDALVNIQNLEVSVEEAIAIHKNLIEVDKNGEIVLKWDRVILDAIDPAKLKGHRLSDNVMTYSVPFMMLYLYINPTLHYLVDTALLVTILKNCTTKVTHDDLLRNYHDLRSMLVYEFVTCNTWEMREFEDALRHSNALNLINQSSDGNYQLGENILLQEILVILIEPFLYTYFMVASYFSEYNGETCDEKTILSGVQKEMEVDIEGRFIHPYSLNLDTISNCLNSFVSMGSLVKTRSKGKVIYTLKKEDLIAIKNSLAPLICELREGHTMDSINLQLQPKL